jgi:hypothetical protein
MAVRSRCDPDAESKLTLSLHSLIGISLYLGEVGEFKGKSLLKEGTPTDERLSDMQKPWV